MRESWSASTEFPRPTGEDAVGGKDDILFVMFTSGTTEHPKMVAHNHLYPLGHYITAKYWHCNKPGEVHLTVSDTGWGKALWGKLYGQWLCEACVFVFDFDTFSADTIFKLIEKYNISTFCAPPTLYRILIRMDMSKYNLSSLRYCTTAGEALNPEVFDVFKEKTGFTIYEGFGQTETTLTIGNLENTTPRPGSMGKASPMYDVRIMKADGTFASHLVRQVRSSSTSQTVRRTDCSWSTTGIHREQPRLCMTASITQVIRLTRMRMDISGSLDVWMISSRLQATE